MKKEPHFGKFEYRLARRIKAYCKKHGRSPKKWEIIKENTTHDGVFSPDKTGLKIYRPGKAGATDRRAFKNLVALGYVKHSRNGHCWTTESYNKQRK